MRRESNFTVIANGRAINFTVIASECEATQLAKRKKARCCHCAFSFIIIWVALRSLAMTD
jgi:phosphoribosyl 1,2-cyclic phosphodiesterase